MSWNTCNAYVKHMQQASPARFFTEIMTASLPDRSWPWSSLTLSDTHTANVTEDLSLSQYHSRALLPTRQLWVLWLLSSSPHLSLLWFHSCWALCCQRTGPALLRHINLQCTLSVCSCSQGGMCSGCCCLCVLSSAGVSACCLCLFVLAEHCSEMSYPWWVCKATTKQVLPQSPVVLLGDICTIRPAKLSRNNWEGKRRFSLLCFEMKKTQNK